MFERKAKDWLLVFLSVNIETGIEKSFIFFFHDLQVYNVTSYPRFTHFF